MSIKPFTGIGLAHGTTTAKIRYKSTILNDGGTTIEEFDYKFQDGGPVFGNSGYKIRGGIGLEIGRIEFDFIYTRNLFELSMATAHLSFGDPGKKLHSMAFVIGAGF